MEAVIIIVVVISIFAGFLIWSTMMQKKALKVQNEAIQREKLIMQSVEEHLKVSKKQLEQLEHINLLLEEIKSSK